MRPHQRSAAVLTLRLLALGLVGCNRSHDGDDDDGRARQQAPVLEEDKASLAQGVVIRVEIDDDGRDTPGTASMRTLAKAPSGKDEVALARAWRDGAPPARVRGGASELDTDTSSASWDDYSATTDYQSYQPTTYTTQSQSRSYSYSYSTSADVDPYRYYYYGSPSCTSSCTPAPWPSAPKPPAVDLDKPLLDLLAAQKVTALNDADFAHPPQAQVDLGARLFSDPILSGNRNTSCSTCHVARLGTSNGLSLGPTLGASQSRGPFATTDLLPRNSPGLFNHGHASFTRMFWDSRVAADPSAPGGFSTPAGPLLPPGLTSALAAQALFPLASRDEMLGCLAPGHAAASLAPLDYKGIWATLTQRVVADATYRRLLVAAFPGIPTDQIGIQHIANALAAFESVAWRADNAPFDRYLKGDKKALTDIQKTGATYFYGKAQCSGCHAGALQTDNEHHAIAIPQFGPGAGDGPSGRADYGRARLTGQLADRYTFRTPSLRNVAQSAPYGHTGAYTSLYAFVRHYTAPKQRLAAWDRQQVILPFRITDGLLYAQHDDAAAQAELAASVPFDGIPLTEAEIEAIVAFLQALSDPARL